MLQLCESCSLAADEGPLVDAMFKVEYCLPCLSRGEKREVRKKGGWKRAEARRAIWARPVRTILTGYIEGADAIAMAPGSPHCISDL